MIHTAIQVITPANQAISTADAKQQLRVDYAVSADNTEIDNMIQAATLQVESFVSRICMPTVIDFVLSGFPRGGIVLPHSPVTSIDSITYYDEANSLQTLAASSYYYSIYEEPVRIRYKDEAYPSTYLYRFDAVKVRCTVGYVDQASVPKSIRQAILVCAADSYQVRTNVAREKFSNWQSLCYSDRVIHTPGENDN
jgi:uncharacterized phiE125 gp8 family phage protein